MDNIRKKLIHEGYILHYKTILQNSIVSYRCSSRKDCKVIVHFKESDVQINNSNSILNSVKQYHFHTCDKSNHELSNNQKQSETTNKIQNLILYNIEKPLSFHISNIKNNGFILSDRSVRYLLAMTRSLNYPSDTKFLEDPFIFKFNLNPNGVNLADIAFLSGFTFFL